MLFGLRNNYFSKEKRNEFAHVPRQLFITQQMPPKIGYLFYSSEDLEVRASSLVPRIVSLNKELYSTLSLSSPRCINGYKRHTAWGNPAMD